MNEHMEANRRRWDELVGIHVEDKTAFYSVDAFRNGADVLGPIENAELGDVAGKDLVHLQCHFGLDTMSLARRGARVTGLDFSSNAVAAARALAAETGTQATFVEGNLYDAPDLIEGRFDIAYVTWGAIIWLPDIRRWAEIVAHLLRPGGKLFLLEGHPFALTLEEEKDGRIVPTYPYFVGKEPWMFEEEGTYTGDERAIENRRSYEWNHPVSDIINALGAAGFALEYLHEHGRLAWQLLPCMVRDADGMYVLPADKPAMPLSFSLKALKA